jgi:hypothetical protein
MASSLVSLSLTSVALAAAAGQPGGGVQDAGAGSSARPGPGVRPGRAGGARPAGSRRSGRRPASVPKGAFAFKLVLPAGSAQAASGTAVARQDASGSWDVTVTVHHVEHLDSSRWYECWYVSQDRQKAMSAGTFLVPHI